MDELEIALALLDAEAAHVAAALVRLRGYVPALEVAIYDRILNVLGKLTLSGGNVKSSVANLRVINDLRRELIAAGQDPALGVWARQFAVEATASAGFLNNYFSTILETYAPKPLYSELVSQYVGATVDALAVGVIQAQIAPAAEEILRIHVTSGLPIGQLRAKMRAATGLGVQADVIADNALNQYGRHYLQAVTADLNLQHWYYKGTKKDNSRTFCVDKVGKYYTEAEVLSWADNGQKWAGMIKGTDQTNIKIYLGGHRCTHRLAPITAGLYNLKTAA